jgi:hypothetical protein
MALPLETKFFQAPMTLKEALGLIQEKLHGKYKQGDGLPILIDTETFKEENPDCPDIFDTNVRFPSFMPKQLSVYNTIRKALYEVSLGEPTRIVRNGAVEVVARGEPAVLIHDGWIEITTKLAASKRRGMRELPQHLKSKRGTGRQP